ncbi:MAG: glycosyltransferase [Steroidobacteraceae bacterium]
MAEVQPLSLGVSIVLYRTRAVSVSPLVRALLDQGAGRVYLIDNSPYEFRAFEGFAASERVTQLTIGRNVGYGRANNLAIRASVRVHAYHLVCNPDIGLPPDSLQRLHAMMESRPDVGLCMPRVVGLDGELQYLCKRSPRPLDYLSGVLPFDRWAARRRARLEMRERCYESEMEVECLSGCFMFFRSSVLAEAGGFDERFFLYFEDFDLSRRARSLARNLYFPAVTIAHGHERAHTKSIKARMHFVMSAARYFNKWGWIAPEA